MVAVLAVGLWLSGSFSEKTSEEAGLQESEAPTKPKPRVAVTAVPKQPVVPPKPISVIAGEDDDLIRQARDVLQLNAGVDRTAKWQQLVDRGEFFHLVRFTELPAQPALDADRIALRYAAVKKLGERGKLGDLIRQREAVDKRPFSKVQFMAWEEWARIAPAAAVTAWHERFTRSEPSSTELSAWTKIFTKGLAEGRPDEAAAAIQNLPPREQEILKAALADIREK